MKLSEFERISLINQLSIRKALEKTDIYDEEIAILSGGYELFYRDLPARHGIYESMDDDHCRFVLDVLEMYRLLSHFFETNPGETELAKQPFARFGGFDGNDSYEGACMTFTRFLVDVQGKWAEQKPRKKETDGFNSHMPVREIYERMLQRYKPLMKAKSVGDDIALTADEAKQILAPK